MSRNIITTSEAPAAIGPYSQAVTHNGLLFCSGQIPLDPASGEIVGTTVAEQAKQCLTNLGAVCSAAGTELTKALKVTLYLVDMSEFAAVNEVYGSFFASDPPARVGLAVAELPKGARCEIDAIVPLD